MLIPSKHFNMGAIRKVIYEAAFNDIIRFERMIKGSKFGIMTLNQRSNPDFAAPTDSEGYKKINRNILRITIV